MKGNWIFRPHHESSWRFANLPGVIPSVGIMAFAFMCHHNVFLIYGSIVMTFSITAKRLIFQKWRNWRQWKIFRKWHVRFSQHFLINCLHLIEVIGFLDCIQKFNFYSFLRTDIDKNVKIFNVKVHSIKNLVLDSSSRDTCATQFASILWFCNLESKFRICSRFNRYWIFFSTDWWKSFLSRKGTCHSGKVEHRHPLVSSYLVHYCDRFRCRRIRDFYRFRPGWFDGELLLGRRSHEFIEGVVQRNHLIDVPHRVLCHPWGKRLFSFHKVPALIECLTRGMKNGFSESILLNSVFLNDLLNGIMKLRGYWRVEWKLFVNMKFCEEPYINLKKFTVMFF